MPFILDMAPVYEGFTADIGYSGCLGLNPVHDRLLADLEAHRELILREVRERRPLREIYEDVDRLMARQGYANRHRAYPFGVIAHKVDRVRRAPLVPARSPGSARRPSRAWRPTRCTATGTAGPRCGARTRSPTTRRSRACGRWSPTSDSGERARSSRRSWSSRTPRTRRKARSGWTTICRMCGAGRKRGRPDEGGAGAGPERPGGSGAASGSGAARERWVTAGGVRAVRRRAGGPGAAHGAAGARLPGQQGGVVARSPRGSGRPLPCGALRRAGPRPVRRPRSRCAAASRWRS